MRRRITARCVGATTRLAGTGPGRNLGRSDETLWLGRRIGAKRLDPNALQPDASPGGKADSRMIVTLAIDGRKMHVESTDLEQATTTRFVARKQ